MTFALAAGIESIRPCLEIDEARALAESIGRDRVILGGERQGLPIEGFDSGNSPSSYTRGDVPGQDAGHDHHQRHPRPACEPGGRGRPGRFVPVLSATVGRVRSVGLPVHIVCAGTDGEVSLEDTLLAGAIVRRLDPRSEWRANDSAPRRCPSVGRGRGPGGRVVASRHAGPGQGRASGRGDRPGGGPDPVRFPGHPARADGHPPSRSRPDRRRRAGESVLIMSGP